MRNCSEYSAKFDLSTVFVHVLLTSKASRDMYIGQGEMVCSQLQHDWAH